MKDITKQRKRNFELKLKKYKAQLQLLKRERLAKKAATEIEFARIKSVGTFDQGFKDLLKKKGLKVQK